MKRSTFLTSVFAIPAVVKSLVNSEAESKNIDINVDYSVITDYDGEIRSVATVTPIEEEPIEVVHFIDHKGRWFTK